MTWESVTLAPVPEDVRLLCLAHARRIEARPIITESDRQESAALVDLLRSAAACLGNNHGTVHHMYIGKYEHAGADLSVQVEARSPAAAMAAIDAHMQREHGAAYLYTMQRAHVADCDPIDIAPEDIGAFWSKQHGE